MAFRAVHSNLHALQVENHRDFNFHFTSLRRPKPLLNNCITLPFRPVKVATRNLLSTSISVEKALKLAFIFFETGQLFTSASRNEWFGLITTQMSPISSSLIVGLSIFTAILPAAPAKVYKWWDLLLLLLFKKLAWKVWLLLLFVTELRINKHIIWPQGH